MALGVNYGAFSVVFSASLAGLLWRSILARKGIFVSSFDFVRYNVGIIAVSMGVGCEFDDDGGGGGVREGISS